MKRISFTVLAFAVASLLVACGGRSKSAPTVAVSGGNEVTGPASPTGAAGAPSGAAAPTTNSASAPAAAGSGASQASGSFGYGFNVFWWGQVSQMNLNQKTIDMVKGAGFNWVRIPIQWSQVERQKDQWDPAPIDRLVDQYQAAGVKVLANVVDVPDWARDPSPGKPVKNDADFAGFMHFLAERYKGKIAAYEIWNEENLASDMNGYVSVPEYAELLKAGYLGAKQADPDITILFGGLTPTGVSNPTIAIDDVDYLKAFYALDGGAYTKYFDVLGVHVNATDQPPDKMIPDNPGTGPWSNDPSFYFRRAEQIHQVMADNHDTRPVWITEFGWTTANQAKGYEYGNNVTPQDQASYLVGAFTWADEHWPWVTAMFVWNLNYSIVPPPSDEKYPWSVLNSDWSPRPAYDALKAMPKR